MSVKPLVRAQQARHAGDGDLRTEVELTASIFCLDAFSVSI